MFKQYDRLFAFGCSFTDYIWSTWPEIIAYDLDIPFYNYGKRGAGNQFIANAVMQADAQLSFTDRDLVIVCWTNVCREDKWVNGLWITPGNIYTQGIYDNHYVKKFADPDGYLVRDTATISMIDAVLTNRRCDYYFLSMVDTIRWLTQYTPNEASEIHRRLHNMYEMSLNKIKPSYYEVLWNDDTNCIIDEFNNIFGGKFSDVHPLPMHHLNYLTKVFDTHSFKQSTFDKVSNINSQLVDFLLIHGKDKNMEELIQCSPRIGYSNPIVLI